MPESAVLPEAEPELTPPDEREGKYLIFRLGHGDFGTAIGKVREVMEMQSITRVPNAPTFIAGVINLRGQVIPVVDLRLTFGLPAQGPTPQSCMVVFKVALASSEQTFAVIVDAVNEVLQVQSADFLKPEQFKPRSESGIPEQTPYLAGVARIEGKVKLLLDIDEVLNHLDLRQVPALSNAA